MMSINAVKGEIGENNAASLLGSQNADEIFMDGNNKPDIRQIILAAYWWHIYRARHCCEICG